MGSLKQLIDVGGFSLSAECAGAGRPAIVLEAGGSSPCDTWDPVWPGLVALSRAFRYDRAGLGKSERSPHPRTIRQMVAELHDLLTPRGRLVLAERSGHMVHHDEPELAVDAVRSVLETARIRPKH